MGIRPADARVRQSFVAATTARGGDIGHRKAGLATMP